MAPKIRENGRFSQKTHPSLHPPKSHFPESFHVLRERKEKLAYFLPLAFSFLFFQKRLYLTKGKRRTNFVKRGFLDAKKGVR